MKAFFNQYKSIIYFILKYFSVYLILLLAYNFYLNSCKKNESIDFFTCNTTFHSHRILHFIDSNYDKKLINNSYFEILYQDKALVRIVEGCNSISVIILFIAFVLAFSKRIKKTLEFVLFGSITIYIFNIIRIVCIILSMKKFPDHQDFLHQVVFPMLLYGYVFVLWIYWIKKVLKND